MRFQMLKKAIAVLACTSLAIAVEQTVDLKYAKYKGRIVGDGTTQWLGLRYGAPPLGNLRFAAPRSPSEVSEVQDASKFGPICLPGNPTDWTTRPNPRFTLSEDCLFLNVFAPSNATEASKLPVMFFIQGGGFNSNSNMNYNGSDLAREGNMIVVSINYRVGPYGFLMSDEIEKEGGLNAGIRDQIKALEWVRDNIATFGGNPEHVVIDGDSAGAASVMILLASPALRDANLFVGAISESTYQNTYRTLEQGKAQYDCLVEKTGCSSSNSTLSCLRSINATALQTTDCWFNPNLDPEVIPQLPFDAFAKGDYLKIPTILGACNEEGTKNIPQAVDSLTEVHDLLTGRAPSLSNSSLSVLDSLYFNPNQSWPVFPNAGKYWRPLSRAYAEIYSTCVDNIYQDIMVEDGVPTWNYRYGVLDPTHEAQGFGAYHVVEMFAIWGPNNTDGNPPKSYNNTNAAIIPVIRNYWTSFIRHLDPNVGKVKGAPAWEERGLEKERLHFITNATAMETLSDEQIYRCKVLDPLVRVLEYEPEKGTVTELEL